MAGAHDEQWRFVLSHEDVHVRRIAERAVEEPTLRALFPYVSLSNLRFSVRTEYPYDPLPHVLTNSFEGVYEARDWDNRPLAKGDLGEVVPAVARAVRDRLSVIADRETALHALLRSFASPVPDPVRVADELLDVGASCTRLEVEPSRDGLSIDICGDGVEASMRVEQATWRVRAVCARIAVVLAPGAELPPLYGASGTIMRGGCELHVETRNRLGDVHILVSPT